MYVGELFLTKNEKSTKSDVIQIAQAVSFIFHPFLIAPLAIALVLYLSSGDFFAAFWWAALCTLLFTIPLVLFLVYKLARKELTDVDISVREQRHGFYLFGAACMLVCFGVLLWLKAPQVVLEIFIGGLLTVIIFALTTRFLTKISVHAGAMAAATVATAFYSWPWAIALAAATALVIWSRLTLKRHTSVEIISGVTIAGGILFLAMLVQK